MVLIEIRPHPWGWKVFEAPGVEPVFLEKRLAIDYAETRAWFGFAGESNTIQHSAKRSLPTPGNSTVKGAPVPGMKNLGIWIRARVRDHIDRGSVALVCQVPAIDKD